MLNIETASYELSIMKYFTKIDLKPAYNQIEIGDNFKEVTTISKVGDLSGGWLEGSLFNSYYTEV